VTIISTFSIDEHPVLIGDLMVSGFNDEKNYKPFNTPASEDVNNLVPKILWRMVKGLKSKVLLINNRLAVGWAGSEIAARTVLTELSGSIDENNFSIKDVYDFIDSIDDLGKQELSLTGVVLESTPDGVAICRFSWDYDKKWGLPQYSSDVFSTIYGSGSGFEDFVDTLKSIKNKPIQNREINVAEQAITLSLSVLGHMQGQQMRKSSGLSEMYGGGYELVTILNGELKKIDDITYHFWEASSSAKDEVTLRFHNTLKYKYIDDFLVIRKVQLHGVSDKAELKDEVFILPPYLRKMDASEKEQLKKTIVPPSLNSKFSIFYVHIPNKNGPDNVVSLVHYSVKNSPVTYVFEKNDVSISLSSELLQRIQSSINKFNST